MRILAVANQKGGVGKTTTSLALAALMAKRGDRVLVVDLDPHASLSRAFGVPLEPVPHGTYELFDEKPRSIAEVACATGTDRIEIVPAQAALATLERRATLQRGMGLALKRALDGARDDYDVAVLDCAPTLGILMVNALAAADLLVSPTQTEPLALHGLDGMRRTVAMIERSSARTLPIGVLPTMHDKRTRAGTESLLALRRTHGEIVWDECIPLDTRLRDTAKVLRADVAEDPNGKGLFAYARALAWLESLGRDIARAA